MKKTLFGQAALASAIAALALTAGAMRISAFTRSMPAVRNARLSSSAR